MIAVIHLLFTFNTSKIKNIIIDIPIRYKQIPVINISASVKLLKDDLEMNPFAAYKNDTENKSTITS